jgi:hypothetical protein
MQNTTEQKTKQSRKLMTFEEFLDEDKAFDEITAKDLINICKTAEVRDFTCVKEFMSSFDDLNVKMTKDGERLIHLVCKYSVGPFIAEALDIFIKRKCDMTCLTNKGESPLNILMKGGAYIGSIKRVDRVQKNQLKKQKEVAKPVTVEPVPVEPIKYVQITEEQYAEYMALKQKFN